VALVEIYFDGGIVNNRVCIYDHSTKKHFVKSFNGRNYTNNELEYMALIEAIKYARMQYQATVDVTFKGDSRLIIMQVWKQWKINHDHLRALNKQVLILLDKMNHQGLWIDRDRNYAGVYLEALIKNERRK